MDHSDQNGSRDDALVAAALGGDESAFERLLRCHEGRVLRVLRLLGVSIHDREDVAQEVFVRVFRHLGGYRPGRSFSAWLYRITVNATHDFRRREGRREEVAWDENAAEEAEAPVTGNELTARSLLESALDALTERERAVFVLCEMEGLSTREAAASLGITSITIRRHLGRARARLQRLLSGDPRENSKGGKENLAGIDRSGAGGGSTK